MSGSKHTPLPWAFGIRGTRKGCIVNADDDDKVVCQMAHWAPGTGQAEADQEFIIRACNSYGVMLDALEQILDPAKRPDRSMSYAAIAEAAIAKATGKEDA